MHAFQGRTVDNVIAAMEVRYPHLTTQKSFYVEISRARDRAELVTDDATDLRAQLQAVTGERIAALEGIGAMKQAEPAKGLDRDPGGIAKGRRGPKIGAEGPRAGGVRTRQVGGHGPRAVTRAGIKGGADVEMWELGDD